MPYNLQVDSTFALTAPYPADNELNAFGDYTHLVRTSIRTARHGDLTVWELVSERAGIPPRRLYLHEIVGVLGTVFCRFAELTFSRDLGSNIHRPNFGPKQKKNKKAKK